MYSERKIAARIAAAEETLGITLVRRSVEEVDAFESHLVSTARYTYDELGHPTGTCNLTPFEANWILNEQSLCMCDAAYALTRYAFIKDEENVIRRFQFRIPQRLIFDIIAELEDRDASIELMFLKARQLGVSTVIILLTGLRIFFSYGVNAVIGSADQTKTALMANMLFLFYDMLPIWLRPRSTRRVESDRGMLVFGQNASGVSFQHGAQASGIARGTTPTVYLMSECASFSDPVNQIEASLFKAVHASPAVFGVLEGTGEGDKGWWPDTWRHAKSNWPLGRSRLCPMFLPWCCGVDIYPTKTWLRMRPVPASWHPNHDTRLHVAKTELYIRSTPLLAKHMGDGYRMPIAQQWFWEVNHEEARAKGIESVFLQEMAGDDEEALQRSSESVFGNEVIIGINNIRQRNYAIYGLSGQSIESTHEPDTDDVDYTAERIPIRYQSKGADTYRWELIPLRFRVPLREDDPTDAEGKLMIFHPPRKGVNYSIGVDTSEGKGEDSTVISVWALGYKGQPDIQCAEFSSPYVNHVEAFAFVLAVAAHYAREMEPGVTRWKEPYVSIEQVAAVGDTCQLQMRKMGYNNFHRMTRYDSKRINKTKSQKLGWYTYGWSRPILTTNFVHAAQNGWAEINSPWMIEEMKQFEVHLTAAGKERLEHEDGAHDDRIFAGAMAIFCPHDLDTLADRSQKRSVESTTLPTVDTTPYAGYVMTAAERRESRVLTLTDVLHSDNRSWRGGR